MGRGEQPELARFYFPEQAPVGGLPIEHVAEVGQLHTLLRRSPERTGLPAPRGRQRQQRGGQPAQRICRRLGPELRLDARLLKGGGDTFPKALDELAEHGAHRRRRNGLAPTQRANGAGRELGPRFGGPAGGKRRAGGWCCQGCLSDLGLLRGRLGAPSGAKGLGFAGVAAVEAAQVTRLKAARAGRVGTRARESGT